MISNKKGVGWQGGGSNRLHSMGAYGGGGPNFQLFPMHIDSNKFCLIKSTVSAGVVIKYNIIPGMEKEIKPQAYRICCQKTGSCS